jgi:transmembrane sensor
MAPTPLQPTPEVYEQASHWVCILHDGDCSPEQRRDFHVWLDRNTQNQQAYQEVEAYWQQLQGLESIAKSQLSTARRYKQINPSNRHLYRRQGLAIAATFILMVLAYPFSRLYLDNGRYQTAKGQHLAIDLSDGTHIDLNTDTEIQVSYTFFARKVRLERGEALFTVQHDAEKPFEVAASDSLIRDIGTQFNVYKQADIVSVTVLEGEVSVSELKAKEPQLLTKGMQYSYGLDPLNHQVKTGDFTDVASWRVGRIVFKGQQLDLVLEQLSRYHAVKLSTGNANLGSLKVSGSFPTSDLTLALNTIAASLPIKISRPRENEILLLPEGKVKK